MGLKIGDGPNDGTQTTNINKPSNVRVHDFQTNPAKIRQRDERKFSENWIGKDQTTYSLNKLQALRNNILLICSLIPVVVCADGTNRNG